MIKNNTNTSYYSNKTSTGNTNTLPSKKQPLERIRFKVDKSLIIGESEYSLLYKLSDTDRCWISKKICFANNYTNWINVSPATSAVFKCMSETGEYELRAEQLKRIVEEEEVNKQWM